MGKRKGLLGFSTDAWKKEWKDMPEFVQEDQDAFKSLTVNFVNKQDMEVFARLVGQPLTMKTQSIWYPKAEIRSLMGKKYIDRKDKENES